MEKFKLSLSVLSIVSRTAAIDLQQREAAMAERGLELNSCRTNLLNQKSESNTIPVSHHSTTPALLEALGYLAPNLKSSRMLHLFSIGF